MADHNSYTIYHNLVINIPASRVFEGVSDPDHLVNWWPLKCSGQAREGMGYNFFFGPEYDWYAKVTQLKKNRSIHFKMTSADPDWTPTTFGFDLEELSGKTKLAFFHTGWREANEHFKIASYCWAMLLKGLKDYLENGVVIQFQNRS